MKMETIKVHGLVWVELGQEAGHELSRDRCWLHHVGVLREMRDKKNIDGGKISHEIICRFYGGRSASAVLFGYSCN